MSERQDGDCSGTAARGEGRRNLAGLCGYAAEDLVSIRQVHGCHVIAVDGSHRGRGAFEREEALGEADGMVTHCGGLPLGISVADCVPVFLFAPRAGVGALVHAGREGTRLGIAGGAVASMERLYGAAPRDVYALIGPSAGPCCYEVSAGLATSFREAGLPVDGLRLDLWEANRLQLENGGVPSGQVRISGRCTICDGAFHSYRAGATAARNMAVLML